MACLGRSQWDRSGAASRPQHEIDTFVGGTDDMGNIKHPQCFLVDA
jgi:hypothetical protein